MRFSLREVLRSEGVLVERVLNRDRSGEGVVRWEVELGGCGGGWV